MLKIGLISDTHSFLDEKVMEHFKEIDEIWHMGDIGDLNVLEKLKAHKPTRAVWGNIDSQEARYLLPEVLTFECEGLKILITHIGAVPPRFNTAIKNLIKKHEPDLFLCGHSHILRVIKSTLPFKTLYINPGAAGKHGFHKMRTVMRMHLHEGKVAYMDVVELGLR